MQSLRARICALNDCIMLSLVTIQEGVPGDYRPLAGARGVLANSLLFSKAAEGGTRGDLNSYYLYHLQNLCSTVLFALLSTKYLPQQ